MQDANRFIPITANSFTSQLFNLFRRKVGLLCLQLLASLTNFFTKGLSDPNEIKTGHYWMRHNLIPSAS